MFPGAGAQVYYNEAGEPLGWDYPDTDVPHDPDRDDAAADCAAAEAYESGESDAADGLDADEDYGHTHTRRGPAAERWLQDSYDEGYAAGCERDEDDGQPSELTEWEDFEGSGMAGMI